MALADITVADSQSTPVNHTFTFSAFDKSGRSVRQDLSRTPDVPLTLTIGHKKGKVNGVEVDSHLAKLDNTVLDSDGVTPRIISFRVAADIDPQIFSDALSDDMITMLHNVMTEVFTRAWARGSHG